MTQVTVVPTGTVTRPGRLRLSTIVTFTAGAGVAAGRLEQGGLRSGFRRRQSVEDGQGHRLLPAGRLPFRVSLRTGDRRLQEQGEGQGDARHGVPCCLEWDRRPRTAALHDLHPSVAISLQACAMRA